MRIEGSRETIMDGAVLGKLPRREAVVAFEDVMYVPSTKLNVIVRSTEQGADHALMLIAFEEFGLHVSLPPKNCRQLSEQLLLIAEMLEDAAQATATDHLQRARDRHANRGGAGA